MSTTKKIIILLADDDDDDRDFFREALDQLNYPYELIAVNDGEKVLDFFKKTKQLPDFIFLDINMPRLNGIECLKFIKNTYPQGDFHVVMLSTATGQVVVEQSYKLGASLYIQKPSKFNELAKYLHYCIMHLKHGTVPDDFILNEKLKSL